jgi:predicted nucleotidyltransferase
MGIRKVRRKKSKTTSLVGRKEGSLLDALFTSTQQKMLELFFDQSDRQFALKDLISLAESGSGAVQREVEKLSQAGLISVEQVGRLKFYRANHLSPVFEEIKSIISKTAGLAPPIKSALLKLKPDIKLAFIYGSVAKKVDSARSDIDLLIVSDGLDLGTVYEALAPIEKGIGRSISPTLYTEKEWRDRLISKNAFVINVMSGKKIRLIGDDLETA